MTSHLATLCFVKKKQKITQSKVKVLKRQKKLSDSEYSQHESENSFDQNEDNEIDNLDELFKGLGLEPGQFRPTKLIMKNQRKGVVRLRRKTSS